VEAAKKKRMALAEQLYDETARCIVSGCSADEAVLRSAFQEERTLWDNSSVWADLQRRSRAASVDALGVKAVPLPDRVFRVVESREDLLLFPTPDSLYTVRTSGTTDAANRGVGHIDAVAAPVHMLSLLAAWLLVVRDLGHDSFCSKMEFPTYRETIQSFVRPGGPYLVPTALQEKPFSAFISLFPDPENAESLPEFDSSGMVIAYHATQMGRSMADETFHAVIPGPLVSGRRIPPFAPDWEHWARIASNRNGKPIAAFMPTPTHIALYEKIKAGELPPLSEGDLIVSGGGSKGRTLHPVEGAESIAGFAVNGLGSTLDGGAFWGKPLRSTDVLSSPDWTHHRDAPLVMNLAYGAEEGVVEGDTQGARLVVDPVMGLCRPGLHWYPGDTVRRCSDGIYFAEREI